MENVAAVLMLWYPGEAGGSALADVLFGDFSPAGRLPVTFPRSLDDVPPFDDYAMAGRTYRYMQAEPLLPFGFGLSYTRFEYGGLKLAAAEVRAGDELALSVDVRNVGPGPADEVVQLYLKDEDAPAPAPLRRLVGFRRVTLRPGEKRTLRFTLPAREMARFDERGRCLAAPGAYTLTVGGSQGDARSLALGAEPVLTARFAIVGEPRELPA